jgi:alpha-1,6-mannosyltransferase
MDREPSVPDPKQPPFSWRATAGLLALAGALEALFYYPGHYLAPQPALKTHVPEFIALSLVAGALYVVAVYLVEKFPLGSGALLVILTSAVVFRLSLLPVEPQLSDDVYRYQWEGRVERAHVNPYTVFPAMPGLRSFQDPRHPLESAPATPTLYPPLSEAAFSWVKTVPGYKRLFTALDLSSIGVLLLLLAALKQPLHRILAYAWNPTVVVSFAMCGHHDSLAILALLVADLLMIAHRRVLSIVFLTASLLAKFFPVVLVPVFIRRIREGRGRHRGAAPWLDKAPVPVSVGVCGALVALGYSPYLGAGPKLFQGLSEYAAGWEANDSFFRLVLRAGNSKAQAELVAATIMLGLVAYAVKNRMGPLRASLFLTASLVLVSPDAFPWYFTWSIPFLCFYPSGPWLLASVTAVLGYAPVVAYAAGQPYRDSPWVLALEYIPVYAWLGIQLARENWRSINQVTSSAQI